MPRGTASLIGSSRGFKKLGEPIHGVLIKDELVPQAVRACLDLAPACPSQKLAELGGGGYLIGMGLGRATLRP